MTFSRTIAIAMGVVAAASLAGCASAPVPGAISEQLWFDKATGYDINHIQEWQRIQGLRGYPHSDRRGIRILPPPDEP